MEFQYRSVLIAVDGSGDSTKAFNRAIMIAKRDEAELVIAHVIDMQHSSMYKTYLDLDEVRKNAQLYAKEMLREHEEIAKEAGILKMKTVLKEGSPKWIIIEEIIPEEKIDLVILGATGVTAVERMLLGSVTESVFRHAKCDVLVVK